MGFVNFFFESCDFIFEHGEKKKFVFEKIFKGFFDLIFWVQYFGGGKYKNTKNHQIKFFKGFFDLIFLVQYFGGGKYKNAKNQEIF